MPEEPTFAANAERVGMSASGIIKFNFHGDELDAVIRDGKPLIAFKPDCARISVPYSPQLVKLIQEECVGITIIVTPTNS